MSQKINGLQDLSGKIISYIGTHFTQNLSQEMIANHFGIGKYALSRIFSNVLHQSFNRYLNSLRINYAKHLLTTSNYSITRIAIECAYNNQRPLTEFLKSLQERPQKNIGKISGLPPPPYCQTQICNSEIII